MEPVEAGGDLLIHGRILVQITGHLVANELVEGLVGVEGTNDPVPVGTEVTRPVGVQSIGVGQAHQVRPVACHVLAILRTREERIDPLLVGIGRLVRLELGQLFEGRRQTGEIKGQPAKQGSLVGFRARRKRFILQPGQDMAIDCAVAPLPLWRSGHDDRLLEGPESVVFGPLLDPSFDEVLFRRGQWLLVGISRRHDLILVVGGNVIPEFALLQIARFDGMEVAANAVGSVFTIRLIQPQLALALVLVRSVTLKASVREDRAHVPVEIDRRGTGSGGSPPNEHQNAASAREHCASLHGFSEAWTA